jgi:hypothetical protein
MRPEAEKTADGDASCPGCAAGRKTRPKRNAAPHAGIAHATPSKEASVNPPNTADTAVSFDTCKDTLAFLENVPIVGPGLAGIAFGNDLRIPEILNKGSEFLFTSNGPPAATNPTKTVAANPTKTAAVNPTTTTVANPAKFVTTNLPKSTAASLPKDGVATRPKATGRNAAEADRRKVRIGDMCLVAPKTWTREQPPMDFLLAQFILPGVAGDPTSAQLTVAAAGETGPRSLARLREQLKQKPAEGSVEHLQIGDNEVVLVDSTGDYGDASDPLPPPVNEGRYRALNAIVFLGDKVYFVNCTGPEKIVGERLGEFRAFLQTLKLIDQS